MENPLRRFWKLPSLYLACLWLFAGMAHVERCTIRLGFQEPSGLQTGSRRNDIGEPECSPGVLLGLYSRKELAKVTDYRPLSGYALLTLTHSLRERYDKGYWLKEKAFADILRALCRNRAAIQPDSYTIRAVSAGYANMPAAVEISGRKKGGNEHETAPADHSRTTHRLCRRGSRILCHPVECHRPILLVPRHFHRLFDPVGF